MLLSLPGTPLSWPWHPRVPRCPVGTVGLALAKNLFSPFNSQPSSPLTCKCVLCKLLLAPVLFFNPLKHSWPFHRSLQSPKCSCPPPKLTGGNPDPGMAAFGERRFPHPISHLDLTGLTGHSTHRHRNVLSRRGVFTKQTPLRPENKPRQMQKGAKHEAFPLTTTE